MSAQSAAESADLDAQQTQADRQAAEDAAQEAQSAKQAAASSAASASSNAGAAYQMSTTAKSWAVGGTGTRPGEDTNNAKYWCDNAAAIAGGGVLSFNGRGGVVIPQAGDYDCAMVGADAAGAAQAAVSAHNSQSGAHATAGGGFRAGTGASSSGDGVGIGKAANGNGDKTIAIGQTAYSYSGGIAIGAGATAGSVNGDTTKAAIQLGAGQNRAGGTLKVFDNLLLDEDGLIPENRMQHILVNQVSELNTWTQRYEASVTLAENENVKVVSFLYDYDQDYEGRALFLEITSFDEECVVTGNIIHDYGSVELEDGTQKSVAHIVFRREQGAASYEKMVFYRVLVAPCLKQKPLEVTS